MNNVIVLVDGRMTKQHSPERNFSGFFVVLVFGRFWSFLVVFVNICLKMVFLLKSAMEAWLLNILNISVNAGHEVESDTGPDH